MRCEEPPCEMYYTTHPGSQRATPSHSTARRPSAISAQLETIPVRSLTTQSLPELEGFDGISNVGTFYPKPSVGFITGFLFLVSCVI